MQGKEDWGGGQQRSLFLVDVLPLVADRYHAPSPPPPVGASNRCLSPSKTKAIAAGWVRLFATTSPADDCVFLAQDAMQVVFSG